MQAVSRLGGANFTQECTSLRIATFSSANLQIVEQFTTILREYNDTRNETIPHNICGKLCHICIYYFIHSNDFDFLCFNATFSNMSALSWRPVLMVEEAGVPGENHRPSNW